MGDVEEVRAFLALFLFLFNPLPITVTFFFFTPHPQQTQKQDSYDVQDAAAGVDKLSLEEAEQIHQVRSD